ncbi:MAG: tetratricopeptide repeat protein [Candidatus Aureabacteria bacterium]|nr:tetratricopeptide repeat protein [Candidatus Auribacterota bacterium]
MNKLIIVLKNFLTVLLVISPILVLSYPVVKYGIARWKRPETTPDSPAYCVHKGLELTQQMRFEEGITWYKRAIELNPGYGEPYFFLGLSYLSIGDRHLAQEMYEKLRIVDRELAEELQRQMNI